MKVFLKTRWLVGFFLGLCILACVTINIYFPAEKVESVAEEIVTEIRGSGGEGKEKAPGEKPSKGNDTSSLRHVVLALSKSTAWADEVTTVSNPTIRTLKQRMKARFEQMKTYYQKGTIQEGNDGYVSVSDASGLSLKEKRDLRALVAAENDDRRALYGEVAKALKIDPGQTNKVAQIFAREWQKSVP